ncbi:hypothetical protein LSAT2_019568 [Lamellibrachia satsuma]|nr:hypothetical protein LSAT2_019568 [Lamellibrachia satsuma]
MQPDPRPGRRIEFHLAACAFEKPALFRTQLSTYSRRFITLVEHENSGAPGNLLALPVEARKLTPSAHMYVLALALALALPHVVICINHATMAAMRRRKGTILSI